MSLHNFLLYKIAQYADEAELANNNLLDFHLIKAIQDLAYEICKFSKQAQVQILNSVAFKYGKIGQFLADELQNSLFLHSVIANHPQYFLPDSVQRKVEKINNLIMKKMASNFLFATHSLFPPVANAQIIKTDQSDKKTPTESTNRLPEFDKPKGIIIRKPGITETPKPPQKPIEPDYERNLKPELETAPKPTPTQPQSVIKPQISTTPSGVDNVSQKRRDDDYLEDRETLEVLEKPQPREEPLWQSIQGKIYRWTIQNTPLEKFYENYIKPGDKSPTEFAIAALHHFAPAVINVASSTLGSLAGLGSLLTMAIGSITSNLPGFGDFIRIYNGAKPIKTGGGFWEDFVKNFTNLFILFYVPGRMMSVPLTKSIYNIFSFSDNWVCKFIRGSASFVHWLFTGQAIGDLDHQIIFDAVKNKFNDIMSSYKEFMEQGKTTSPEGLFLQVEDRIPETEREVKRKMKRKMKEQRKVDAALGVAPEAGILAKIRYYLDVAGGKISPVTSFAIRAFLDSFDWIFSDIGSASRYIREKCENLVQSSRRYLRSLQLNIINSLDINDDIKRQLRERPSSEFFDKAFPRIVNHASAKERGSAEVSAGITISKFANDTERMNSFLDQYDLFHREYSIYIKQKPNNLLTAGDEQLSASSNMAKRAGEALDNFITHSKNQGLSNREILAFLGVPIDDVINLLRDRVDTGRGFSLDNVDTEQFKKCLYDYFGLNEPDMLLRIRRGDLPTEIESHLSSLGVAPTNRHIFVNNFLLIQRELNENISRAKALLSSGAGIVGDGIGTHHQLKELIDSSLGLTYFKNCYDQLRNEGDANRLNPGILDNFLKVFNNPSNDTILPLSEEQINKLRDWLHGNNTHYYLQFDSFYEAMSNLSNAHEIERQVRKWHGRVGVLESTKQRLESVIDDLTNQLNSEIIQKIREAENQLNETRKKILEIGEILNDTTLPYQERQKLTDQLTTLWQNEYDILDALRRANSKKQDLETQLNDGRQRLQELEVEIEQARNERSKFDELYNRIQSCRGLIRAGLTLDKVEALHQISNKLKNGQALSHKELLIFTWFVEFVNENKANYINAVGFVPELGGQGYIRLTPAGINSVRGSFGNEINTFIAGQQLAFNLASINGQNIGGHLNDISSLMAKIREVNPKAVKLEHAIDENWMRREGISSGDKLNIARANLEIGNMYLNLIKKLNPNAVHPDFKIMTKDEYDRKIEAEKATRKIPRRVPVGILDEFLVDLSKNTGIYIQPPPAVVTTPKQPDQAVLVDKEAIRQAIGSSTTGGKDSMLWLNLDAQLKLSSPNDIRNRVVQSYDNTITAVPGASEIIAGNRVTDPAAINQQIKKIQEVAKQDPEKWAKRIVEETKKELKPEGGKIGKEVGIMKPALRTGAAAGLLGFIYAYLSQQSAGQQQQQQQQQQSQPRKPQQ